MSAPRLPRYEVIDELGQGGMSVVYRARDKQLSRDVALKVLHDFLAKQTDARRRFHREAVAVAKLHHPGILEIFDYSGPGAEQSYIVTELIEGQTLRALIEEKGKPRLPELGALIVSELVRALRHAHEQGVVHRDLKPENIMVTKSGQLKLMDFGIAQIMGGATKLTATGTLLGSPAHMAPEVIDGQSSDHRSDIFSVGTILYWLTTGELPFAAPNPSALFRKILEGRYEPPQLIEPKIGNRLARTIDRALALSPEDRYQDISELEADLKAELEDVGLVPTEVRAKEMLKAPIAYADAFEPKLVERLASAGEAALGEHNVARAMDYFNRVLAIEPHHEKVEALVARVGRREKLTRGARRAALAAAIALLVGGAAYGATQVLPSLTPTPKETPVAAAMVAPNERGVVGDGIEDEPEVEAEEGAQDDVPVPEAANDAKAAIGTGTGSGSGRREVVRRMRERAPPEDVILAADVARGRAITAPPPERRATIAARRIGPKRTIERAEVTPEADAAEATAEVTARLRIKIRHWANVRIDGVETRHVVNKTFDLTVGAHQVEIIWPGAGPVPAGRFAKRNFVVDESGKLFEVRDGRNVASPGTIEVRIPTDRAQGDSTSGWTWSS